MTVKRQLGAILLESGRINQRDVDQVLEYQRTHGGFFGQAIVALGIMNREEIDWALANQFDLPFIFPNPDAVDREAALLVPADWALAHLAVPIVRAGRTLTVVVADPLDSETLEDLHVRTGYEVEMALASASRIRELIRSIYGDGTPVKADTTPIALADFVADALAAGAERIGVSVRGAHAMGWYTARNTRDRRPLTDGWDTTLEDMLDPSPFDAAKKSHGTMQKFTANLHRDGVDTAVGMQVVSSSAGTEFLLRPTRTEVAKRTSQITLPLSIAAELRLLARTGGARVAMPGGATDWVRDVVPQMPTLVLGDHARAAHVTASDDVPGIYTLRVTANSDDIAGTIEAYDFDAVTTDLPLDDARLAHVVGVAPITFAYIDKPGDRVADADAEFNWILHVTRDQDALAWELRPVNR